MKKVAVLISLLMVIFLFNVSSHAQILTVGSSQGYQGNTLAIPITFSNDLNNVVAMQFDITFDSSLVDITDASDGSALDGTSFSLSTSEPAAGTRRVIIAPPVQIPIPIVPDGEIAVISVYLAGAPGSTATLTLQNVVMSDENGDLVSPVLYNGAITIIPNTSPKDDILGIWSSGVWYRDSETGSWVKMSTPANLV
ncbi:MAG: hypothetical protein LWW99_04765, partial [Deltaproteobacteria bacterium]|nr:hypothetical protein [Deltaproteobacteria bacterium]